MKIYALKSCDTCRKAIRALSETYHEIQVTDVRKDGVARTDLDRFYRVLGQGLINRASTTWRGLSETDRARDPVDLLRDHPTLMKRPVIDHDGQLFLGWKADVQNALLG